MFRTLFIIVVVGIFLSAAGLAYWMTSSPSAAEFLTMARRESRRGDSPAVLLICDSGLKKYPGNLELLALAADAASSMKDFGAAADYLSHVPILEDDSKLLALLLKRAELLRMDGRFSDSLRQLEMLRRMYPSDSAILQQITGIYITTGYREDALKGLDRSLSAGTIAPKDLYVLAKRGALALPRKEMLGHLERHPTDVMLMHAVATTAVIYDDHLQRRTMLERAVSTSREADVPRLELGELLLDDPDPASVQRCAEIVKTISGDEERLAQCWLLRARFLLKLGKHPAAQRCLAEAIARDPRRSECYYLLAGLLKQDGLDGVPLEQAGGLIKELDKAADAATSKQADALKFRNVIELLLRLNRFREALMWLRYANDRFRNPSWTRDMAARIQRDMKTVDEFNLKLLLQNESFNFTKIPLPESWSFTPDAVLVSKDASEAYFWEDPVTSGIHFSYINGASEPAGPRRIQESTGGGIAVVDIDADCWPDLYFAQGGAVGSDRPDVHDCLYRNRNARQFEDVTSLAGITESGYSQGVAAGDVNDDGFCDVYVANAGVNTLLLNQGDGTFLEEGLQDDAGRWTTSVAIADLDGDGLADIYDVNYLGGDDVYTRICHDDDREHLCGPNVFRSAQDQVHLNLGDGSFRESSDDLGFHDTDGRGLGIVVSDLDLDGLCDVYVANDTTPNFLFRQIGKGTYAEQAVVQGVAFDSSGRSLGSMGIAAGDADGNGLPDLFVTNYFMEMNNLYLQSVAGVYMDRAADSELGASSIPMVGFGTQYIDFEHDGDLDLLITNGHVADFSYRTTPYRMRPQAYLNQGAGRFAELRELKDDTYFQKEVLGRSMAKIDWNRDGRDDAVISHLDCPTLVLTNRCDSPGNWFRLRCIGTSSNRDAIGTAVVASVGDQRLLRQLNAGDGYEASNEKLLDFGLGAVQECRTLSVRWPSGKESEVTDVRLIAVSAVVEGRTTLYPLPE